MAKLVTIARFYKATEAEAVRALLEENGIQVFIADAEVASTDFLLTSAVGGVKLQTADIDAEQAKQLIATHGGFQRDAPEDEEALDGSTACLACGAKMESDEDACPQCGWSYESEDADEDHGDDEEEAEDEEDRYK
jgi:hypothetical protein